MEAENQQSEEESFTCSPGKPTSGIVFIVLVCPAAALCPSRAEVSQFEGRSSNTKKKL